uniref:BZIP domain-containing protein n=1 Tax=Chenopodium quinoa TaxID=63459 RepID=A0A803LKN1_CHEQI
MIGFLGSLALRFGPIIQGPILAVKHLRSFVPAVYDVTFTVARDNSPPSLLTLLKGKSSVVKVQVKRHLMHELPETSDDIAQWCTNLFVAKVQRRIAQNCEAARKSRMRKKVYIQQLELSHSKSMQMEQELERGTLVSNDIDPLPFSATIIQGLLLLRWSMDIGLRSRINRIATLNTHITDVELRILVDSGMKHYYDLFQLKAGSAITGPIAKEYADLWPRIASVANAIV